jgi:hypothetical protein
VRIGLPAGPLGAPDRGLIALRVGIPCCISPTAEPPTWDYASFTTPVVIQSVTNTAEPSGRTLALELIAGEPTVTAEVPRGGLGYRTYNPVTLGPVVVSDGGGPWSVAPGVQPALAYQLCRTSPSTRTLRALQQVLHYTNTLPATTTADLIQRFQVPQAGELEWPELAFTGTQSNGPPLEVELLAPLADQPGFDPASAIRIATMTADYPAASPVTISARFSPATRLPIAVTITPGVDYWLRVKPAGLYSAVVTTRTSELNGKLWVQSQPGTPYGEVSDRDLAFRLIGGGRPLVDPLTPTPYLVWNGVDKVTRTAALLPHVSGTVVMRSLAQWVNPATATALGRFTIATGTDGSPVTLVASMRLSDPQVTTPTPWLATYPLINATPTASGGNFGWQSVTLERPIVLLPTTRTCCDDGSYLTLTHPDLQGGTVGRAKVGTGVSSATVTPVLEFRGSSWTPVTGTAMGLAVEASTDADAPSWRVGQAVMPVNDIWYPTATADLVQTFQVPNGMNADWIELAIPNGGSSVDPFHVTIVDPAGQSAPPPGPISTTLTADFSRQATMQGGDSWAASKRFTTRPPLVPVTPTGSWCSRPRAGGSASHIRRARRSCRPARCTRAASRRPRGRPCRRPALSYRIIGVNNSALAVPSEPQAATVLTLRADPTPFSHELAFRWSGGVGRAAIEIYDVNGRRVRRVADAGPRHSWRVDLARRDRLGPAARCGRVLRASRDRHGATARAAHRLRPLSVA